MEYELTETDGVAVLRPGARTMDQNNAPGLLLPLRPFVEAGGRMVLDLSKVQFINSAGLGAIVGLVRDVKSGGGAIRLCSPLPTVRALFGMVRLESIASIDDDLAGALAALARSGE